MEGHFAKQNDCCPFQDRSENSVWIVARHQIAFESSSYRRLPFHIPHFAL
jgi:hypothetical protein